jgi:hypothetical protein
VGDHDIKLTGARVTGKLANNPCQIKMRSSEMSELGRTLTIRKEARAETPAVAVIRSRRISSLHRVYSSFAFEDNIRVTLYGTQLKGELTKANGVSSTAVANTSSSCCTNNDGIDTVKTGES